MYYKNKIEYDTGGGSSFICHKDNVSGVSAYFYHSNLSKFKGTYLIVNVDFFYLDKIWISDKHEKLEYIKGINILEHVFSHVPAHKIMKLFDNVRQQEFNKGQESIKKQMKDLLDV